VFEKKDSERMPMRKAWDHAIDLRERFVPKKGKIYPLSRVEREEVQKFVKDQLRKGVRITGSGLSFYLSLSIFLLYLLFYSPFVLFLACRTRIRGGMSQVT